MGQTPSSELAAREVSQSAGGRTSTKLKERLQVLEDLVHGSSSQRRQELLRDLAGSNGPHRTPYSILPKAPEEFKLGSLIAAGSYGRVYAGTYRGQPAALKLLILDEESAAAILNEVRLCLKLNHRNLVRLLDCAVVSTSLRQFSTNSANLDASYSAGWQYGSDQQGYSYLPMLAGEQQNIPGSPSSREIARASSLDSAGHMTGNDLLRPEARGYGLTSASGHACFEVWIAMELCDGGTLAEQVRRGFQYVPGGHYVDMELLLTVALDIARALSYMHSEHVCHGDLKAENVLLKAQKLNALPNSEAGSSSYYETTSECSWLQMLCNTASAGHTPCRSRRCSNDSCWSFGKSVSSKSYGTVSSRGTASSSSGSGSSSPVPHQHQGTTGKRRGSGHLLSGLCCMSFSACLGEDEDDGEDADRPPTSEGYYCVGLPTVNDNGQTEQDPALSGSSAFSCSTDIASPPDQPHADASSPAQVEVDAAPVLDVPCEVTTLDQDVLSPLLRPLGSNLGEYTPFGDPQQQSVPHVSISSTSSPRGHDEAAEEEHIAPLSLYTTTREHVRSRRLSRSGLLPNVQAALAAAAASGRLDPSLCATKLPSSGSSSSNDINQSGSEEEQDLSGSSGSSKLGAAAQSGQHAAVAEVTGVQRSPMHMGILAVPAAGGSELPAMGSGFDYRASSMQAEAETLRAGPYGGHRQARNRRHSYCYGASSATYSAMCLSNAFNCNIAPAASVLRQQYICSHAGISAAEAAAAIAAAAEAVREDIQTAKLAKLQAVAPNVPRVTARRSRKRRMSCDDRLLQHRNISVSPSAAFTPPILDSGEAVPLVTGLGRLPLALRRTGSGGADQQAAQPTAAGAASEPKQPPGVKPEHRTRRHSWTGACLEGLEGAVNLRMLASFLLPADQQQQQRLLSQNRRKSADWKPEQVSQLLLAGAGSDGCSSKVGLLLQARSSTPVLQGTSSSAGTSGSGARRARRHSWAGYGADQQRLPDVEPVSRGRPRRKSACLKPVDMMAPDDTLDAERPSSRLQQLVARVSCCADGSNYLPLDDTAADAADMLQPLLRDEQQPSSPTGQGGDPSPPVGDVGCLGRLCSRPGSRAGVMCGRSRRSSWCCGTIPDDISMWGLGVQSSSSSSSRAELLPGALYQPSLPSHGLSRGRAGRRSSWDGTSHTTSCEFCVKESAAAVVVPVTLSGSNSISSSDGAATQQTQVLSSMLRTGSILPGSASMTASGPSVNTTRSSTDKSAAIGSDSSSVSLLDQLTALSDIAVAPAALSGTALVADPPLIPQQQQQLTGQGSSTTATAHPSAVEQQAQPSSFSSSSLPLRSSDIATTSSSGVVPRTGVSYVASVALPGDILSSPGNVGTAAGPLSVSPAAAVPIALPAITASSPAQQPGVSSMSPVGAGHVLHSKSNISVQSLTRLGSQPGAQLQQQQQQPAADLTTRSAATAPADAATGGSGALDRDSPMDLFTGSWDFRPTDGSKHSSRRSSIISAIVDQGAEHALNKTPAGSSPMPTMQAYRGQFSAGASAATNTSSSSKQASGVIRERRWSTGVAAHDLLQRQLNLPAASVKVRRASALLSGEVKDIFDGPCAGPSAAAPPGRAVQCEDGAVLSSSHVVNVLGMPLKPKVLAQRRMSYDTATGAYYTTWTHQETLAASSSTVTVAAKLQQAEKVLSPRGLQQRLAEGSEQQTAVEPQQPQQEVQPQQTPQQQAEIQQHMQRLIEALSRKGYAGISFDSNSNPTSPKQQLPPQQQMPILQPPQEPAPKAFAAHPGAPRPQSTPAGPTHHPPPAYSRPRYCAKVCDFGFSQCLRAGQSHCSTFAAGTITHQAPEVLRSGYLSPAADIYAFGIILWELLTGERPFRGLLEGDVVCGVCDKGLRPQFPAGSPEAYVALAQQCWAEDIADRPTARQLLKRLNEMLYEVRRQKQTNSSAAVACFNNSATPSSRHRRHSMPPVIASRKRRSSRRLSLFLPFGRQPVPVPEHEPLDERLALDPSPMFSGGSSAVCSPTAGPASAPAVSDSTRGGVIVVSAGASSSSTGVDLGRIARSYQLSERASAPPPAGTGSTAAADVPDGFEWFQSFD